MDRFARWAASRFQHRFGRFVAWPTAHSRAEREARNAIERARGRAAADRDGNVIRPKAFKRKKRDLH